MQENKNKSIQDFLNQFKDKGNGQSGKKKTQISEPIINLPKEFDNFVKEDIADLISFKVRGFNDYIQYLDCSIEITEMLYKVVKEMRRLPASNSYHGAYDGGYLPQFITAILTAEGLAILKKYKLEYYERLLHAQYRVKILILAKSLNI